VATADIRYDGASLELALDSFESRNPRMHQVRRVVGPEKAFSSEEQVGIVLVPAHAVARAKGLSDLREVLRSFGFSQVGRFEYRA